MRIRRARNGDARFRSDVSDGINALRTYAVPPRWLLDAEQHGLRVRIRMT